MRTPKLTAEQIQRALPDLPGWTYAEKSLRKTYTFADFAASLAFVNRVGTKAEAADHHPDINIRYSKVTLMLSTHDSGGVTEKDLDLAREADHETS